MVPLLLTLLVPLVASGPVTKLANPGEFPYVVSIRLSSNNLHFCVGSVIGAHWVLSSAICFTLPNSSKQIVNGTDLIIYSNTIMSGGTIGNLNYGKNLILHPGFVRTPQIIRNDIALIQVKSSFYWWWQNKLGVSTTSPISIGRQILGSDGLSLAWSTLTPDLKKLVSAKLTVFRLSTTASTTNGCTNSDEFICTINKPNDKTCHYEAGAPLITDREKYHKLVGVASHLFNGCQSSPGSFTRVEYFLPWINDVTKLGLRVE
ncbi:serine protease H159 [Tribolium castaneum]|uniref:Serine protease H159 n=1 Tax=Tribolium castaneum TaxID=7070 RepID=D2A4L9_TRICA|nr:PREDICTED: serine proteases 1/2 [Tribolium castaneum]EFA05723.2 serine protease H159 [Tribolium castaneum]|eukprot:XP_008194479.1 PREDICTED: serine proteases 1/2 [Tribolium castaneum]